MKCQDLFSMNTNSNDSNNNSNNKNNNSKRIMMVLYRSPEQTALHTYY